MLTWIYGLGVRGRLRLYRSGILSTRRLPHTVISVGNLTAGGTGKTPLVMFLARILAKAAFHPVILSRGYKGRAEKSQLLVSDGRTVFCEPEDSGDEPYLMARKLEGVPVVVGADRFASARLAPGFSADPKLVFLLDDGFQHLRLKRDLNILVIDATDPFGGCRLLPAGRLREPLDGMKRADLVIVTRAHLPFDQEELETEVRRRNRLSPIVYFYHDAVGFTDLRTKARLPIRSLENRKVVAMAGIGNPSVFLSDLEHYQVRVVSKLLFRDHHRFSRDDLTRASREALDLGADAIVTTEKDAVRIEGLQAGNVPLLSLEIEVRSEDSFEFEKSFLEDVRQRQPSPAGCCR